MKEHRPCADLVEYEKKQGRPKWVRIREDCRPKAGCEFDTEFQGLQIAVVGLSGVGKSSLINALRELKEVKKWIPGRGFEISIPEGWVTVNHKKENEVFCAKAVRWPSQVIQREPLLGCIKLVDLPGLGTTNVPAANYVQDYALTHYSCFIVVVDRASNPEEVQNLVNLAKGHAEFIIVRNKFNETCRHQLPDTDLQAIPQEEQKIARAETSSSS